MRPVEHDAGVGDVEDLGAEVVPHRLGAGADPPMPARALDQGIDDLGPEGRAGRVAMGLAGGVAEHRVAEIRLVPPDLGDPVPPLDEDVVDLGAGRGDLVEVVQPLGHQPGVEHPLGVDHVLLGVGAGLADRLARLAEDLALRRSVAAGQVLGHDDRRERGTDVDPLVQERGRVPDRLVGRPGQHRVGHAQEQPGAIGVAGLQRAAQQQPAAPRAAQQVGQVVAVEVSLLRRRAGSGRPGPARASSGPGANGPSP